jgi:group I intron endonuclease
MTNNFLQSFLSSITRIQPIFSEQTIELFIGFLHLAELQIITRKELKGKSGIYGFISKTTNKLYIGSSINLDMRFFNHINGIRSNIKLQNAINKYYLKDFIFIVFEYCEPKDLISREQHYIDSLSPEYNILLVAGSWLGHKHTEESIAKMSESKTGRTVSSETIAKISEAHNGKTHSASTIAKISEAMSGENHPMYGKSHSAETLAKMRGKTNSAETRSLMSLAKYKKVFVYSLDSDSKGLILDKSFNSCIDAAKYFDCTTRSISNYLDKDKLYRKQWILSSLELISS